MKQFIVVLATGRCGTEKLPTLLENIPGLYVYNPEVGYDQIRIRSLTDRSLSLQYTQKLIEHFHQPEYDQYQSIFLAGHVIGSNYIRDFVDCGIVPDVVVLRRPPREVASSLYTLNFIPGKNPHWAKGFNGPNEPNVLPFEGWQTAHHYQLCYWYCCEIERRIIELKPYLADHQSLMWEMTLSQMLNVNYFNQMLNFFNWPNVESVSQEKINHTIEPYNEKPSGSFLDKLEADVLNRIPQDERERIVKSWKIVWP